MEAAVHSSWAALEDTMAVIVGEGAKTVHGAAYTDDSATANAEYGTSLRAPSRSILVTMVLMAIDVCATVELTVEDTARFDVDLHGIGMHPYFETAVQMREVAPVDSLEIALCGCTFVGSAADIRTVLHYLEIVLTNRRTAVWRIETLDSSGMHWLCVGTKLLSSRAAFFRVYRAAFLVGWTSRMDWMMHWLLLMKGQHLMRHELLLMVVILLLLSMYYGLHCAQILEVLFLHVLLVTWELLSHVLRGLV